MCIRDRSSPQSRDAGWPSLLLRLPWAVWLKAGSQVVVEEAKGCPVMAWAGSSGARIHRSLV
eukprot:12291655-Heterocapsa_arctica.AAC.1